jgi:hypothetical protein
MYLCFFLCVLCVVHEVGSVGAVPVEACPQTAMHCTAHSLWPADVAVSECAMLLMLYLLLRIAQGITRVLVSSTC